MTETEVTAKADMPAKPLLLAPATTSTTVAVDQAAPAPKAVAEAAPADSATADAGKFHATPREVELAYLRAAARYGYGASASYSEDDDQGSYDTAPLTRVTRARGMATRAASKPFSHQAKAPASNLRGLCFA